MFDNNPDARSDDPFTPHLLAFLKDMAQLPTLPDAQNDAICDAISSIARMTSAFADAETARHRRITAVMEEEFWVAEKKAVAEMATEKDSQIWIEKVSDGSNVGVVIEDGCVKE